MSDYPHDVHAGNGPWNKPDWNGKYQCPECEDEFESEKELKGCWEHETDIAELRNIIIDLHEQIEFERAAYKTIERKFSDYKIGVMLAAMNEEK